MKRFLLQSWLCRLLLPAALAFAQNPQPAPTGVTASQLILPLVTTVAPVNERMANINVVGNPGPATYYYWFVANYTVGSASPSGPKKIITAPNVLSSTNYDQIVFVLPQGATSVDVLRTTTPSQPSGACNCAVATGNTTGVVNDQSSSLNSYTVNPFVADSLALTLQNEVVSAGVTHLILRQNGAFVADLSEIGGVTFETNGTLNLTQGALNLVNSASCTFTNTSGFNVTLTCSNTGIGGSGTANTVPIFTSSSAIGNSNLVVVTSPSGLEYTLGGGEYIRLDSSGLYFNSGITGSSNLIIANTYNLGSGSNAGGVDIESPGATGSACSGNVSLIAAASNSSGNGSSVVANGGCSNGFGGIGANINITAGNGTNNPGGDVILTPGSASGGGPGIVLINGEMEIAGSSAVIGGIQGSTGTKFFATSGNFTQGDLVVTDANGNAVDGGAVPSQGSTVIYSTPSGVTNASISNTGPSSPTGSVYSFSLFIVQVAAGVGCTGSTTFSAAVSFEPANYGSGDITFHLSWQNSAAGNPNSFLSPPTISGNGSPGIDSFQTFPFPFATATATTFGYSVTVTQDATCSTKPTYEAYPVFVMNR